MRLQSHKLLGKAWLGLHLAVQWPFYRTWKQRTVDPAKEILVELDTPLAPHLFNAWIHEKNDELAEIKAAGTVSAAGSIAMVTSDYVQSTTVWYASSLWNASLILAIFALIAAGQEQMLLTKMRAAFDRAFPHFTSDSGPSPPQKLQRGFMDHDDYHVLKLFLFSANRSDVPAQASRSNDVECQSNPTSTVESQKALEWSLSKTMMFLWQCPLVFLSYSWVCFIAAFTLHTIHPPLTGWNEHAKVAVFYLAFLIPSVAVFFWCGTLPIWHSSCTREGCSVLVAKQKHQRANTHVSIQTQRRRNST